MGGISAASLYAAFGSKEALYKEAVALYMATVGRRLRDTLADTDAAPLQAIENALRCAAEFQRDDEHPRGCMVVLSATNCSPDNAHLRRAMALERQNTRLAFRDCLRRGMDAGQLPSTTDAESLADFLSAVLNGLSIQARDELSADALNGIVDTAMQGVAAVAGGRPVFILEQISPDTGK